MHFTPLWYGKQTNKKNNGGRVFCLLFAVIGEKTICNTESEGSTCGLMPDISMSPPRLLTMVWCAAILSICTLKTDGVSIARPAYGVIFRVKVRCSILTHFGPITCSFLMNGMNCCQLMWGKLMNLVECVHLNYGVWTPTTPTQSRRSVI